MKIGVLGSGDVAKVLASGFGKHGHDVMVGTRDRTKLTDWSAQNPRGRTGSFAETANFAEVVVLAVKGTAAGDALRSAGAKNLLRKLVIDATNPIADAPPVNGVLKDHRNEGRIAERACRGSELGEPLQQYRRRQHYVVRLKLGERSFEIFNRAQQRVAVWVSHRTYSSSSPKAQCGSQHWFLGGKGPQDNLEPG
jgi:hypothetical protein